MTSPYLYALQSLAPLLILDKSDETPLPFCRCHSHETSFQSFGPPFLEDKLTPLESILLHVHSYCLPHAAQCRTRLCLRRCLLRCLRPSYLDELQNAITYPDLDMSSRIQLPKAQYKCITSMPALIGSPHINENAPSLSRRSRCFEG